MDSAPFLRYRQRGPSLLPPGKTGTAHRVSSLSLILPVQGLLGNGEIQRERGGQSPPSSHGRNACSRVSASLRPSLSDLKVFPCPEKALGELPNAARPPAQAFSFGRSMT